MTASTVEQPAKKRHDFDPDSYRMTIGEHLEELRTRMILGLAGFFIAAIVCMALGEYVMHWFLRPLMIALEKAHQNPQIYYTEVAESFMVYIKVSLISAATVASPWMLYQLWQFVAAGLYPRERKYITKYLPLMMTFFLEFNFGTGSLIRASRVDASAATQPAYMIPAFDGDPASPVNYQ